MANDNYQVGYKRPPKNHQFKPGESGNPSGRPKGVRSFKSELLEELNEVISVSDSTGTVQVSKGRAVIKTLLRLAIEGDQRAIATVMATCGRAFGYNDTEENVEAPEDHEILQALGGQAKARRTGNAEGVE